MIYTENKLITLNSKYGIQQNGTFKSNILFNFKNLLSDEEQILTVKPTELKKNLAPKNDRI